MKTTSRRAFCIAFITICYATYCASHPQFNNSPNPKITFELKTPQPWTNYIGVSRKSLDIGSTTNDEPNDITNNGDSLDRPIKAIHSNVTNILPTYPSDVLVNSNVSNIEENITVPDQRFYSILPINYNISMPSLEPIDQTTPLPVDTSVMVSHGIYDLGQKIMHRLLANNGKRETKSEVISPLSIAGVAYLLYLGSAGDTATELGELLGLNRDNETTTNQKEIHEHFGRLLDNTVNDREPENDDKEFPEWIKNRVHQISVANGFFLNDYFKLRPQYVNVVKNTYKSEVRSMDFSYKGFEAKNEINDWVSNKTHGKIDHILDAPPNGNTQMIVVSALYFKALWWEELGVQLVMKQPFYPNGEDQAPIDVDTIMFASEFLPYYESKELGCQIFGLRYQKQLTTMYIVQPLVSNRTSLNEFQKELTADKLDMLIKNMKYVHVSTLTFPKFHLQSQTDLKLILKQLGIRSLFTSGNLSPVTPGRYENGLNSNKNMTNDLDYLDMVRKNTRYSQALAISSIHHKVDLDVNERGTEGGAATAAVVDRISARFMRINTPFLFVIRQDATRLPLFYGAVYEPEQD